MTRLLLLFLCAFLSLSIVEGSQVSQPPAQESRSPDEALPGVDPVRGVSELTGVAISPLLGLSALGAYRYWLTPEPQRYLLPWFCKPYVWITGFFLLALCLMKDLFGTVAPPLIKKPLDMAELFESKVSAAVACATVLPFVVSGMSRHTHGFLHPATGLSPGLNLAPLASIPLAAFSFDLRFIAIPLAIVAFLIIWLAGHAINVLIALCPFGFIDAFLKLLKLCLFGSVVVPSFFAPKLGAAISLVILVVAVLIARWAFRLSFFGSRLAWDIIFSKSSRRRLRPAEPQVFLARRLAGVPARTYGRLTCTEAGDIVFRYRPWFILPGRNVFMPAGLITISKGLLFPSLLHRLEGNQRTKMLMIFLPRYRASEHLIAEHLRIIDVRDGALLRGLKAVRAWIADTINIGRSRYATLQNARPG
jgi:hypothetical protein